MTDPDDTVSASELADDELFDELTGFLNRGEEPPQELLDRSASNQIAFRSMLRVRSMAKQLLQVDAASAPALEDGWVTRILGNVRREAHAGRDIPLSHPSPRASLVMTEGAVRGLIRAAGDRVSGALIGSCRLVGDVSLPGASVEVEVEVSVFWGESLPAIANRLRSVIRTTLIQHTELAVSTIDVVISDVHLRRRDQGGLAVASDVASVVDEGIEL